MLDVDAPKIISKMRKERDVEGLIKVLKLDPKDGYVAWAAISMDSFKNLPCFAGTMRETADARRIHLFFD
ncbi:MAG: hypothetical protein ACXW1Q_06760 [Halobacteriota archaeon]